jgi:site-specific recombinase XerD
LAIHVDGFARHLAALGYAEATIGDQVRLMAHLSRWLASSALEAGDLTAGRLDAFRRARQPASNSRRLSPRTLDRLLDYLRQVAVVPGPETPTDAGPEATVLARYHGYLVRERGLVPTTVRGYEAVAREFLGSQMGTNIDLRRLVAADVTQFVVDRCGCHRAGSAQHLPTALRSLLRFLYLEGHTTTQLGSAVPSLAGWRGQAVPRAVDRQQVAKLLRSCPRDTPLGLRDFAILTVLVRLGLRAGEVAALELGDIDWRHGEIMIRGKGNRQERLPLPVDVGEALSAYLHAARRPGRECPQLFLTVLAPIGGLTRWGIADLVHHACDRAGVPRIGPHRLRHTAATEMLRSGVPLADIGQVLRHRSLLTTARYAKVDHLALRTLARSWPGPEKAETGEGGDE